MTKIGAHVSSTPRNTWEAFCKEGRTAAALGLNDSGVGTELKLWTNGHGWFFFRDTTVLPEGTPSDLFDPDTTSTPEQKGDYWYFEHNPRSMKEVFDLNPADAYCITNEQGGGEGPDEEIRRNYELLVAYERQIMKNMNAEGKKAVVLNLGGGSPGDFQIWADICVPFIKEAFDAGNFYGRHAYAGNWERVHQEAQYLLDNGLGYGGVVVTEWGFSGGYGQTHDPDTIIEEDKILQTYPNIVAFLLWEYGKSGWDANIDPIVPQLIPYMRDNPTPKWEPGGAEPTETLEQYLWRESVEEQIRTGLRFNAEAALQKELNQQGLQIVINEIGRNYASKGYTIQAGEDAGGVQPRRVAVYQPGVPVWSFDEPVVLPPTDPLTGLVIAPPFGKPFRTTSEFGVPRVYDGQPYKHEGWDGTLVNKPADSKDPVLAGYPGVVTRSGASGGAYGYRVVVRSDYKGTVFYLWYCHMDSTYVQVGDSVSTGTHLGELGSTGNSTGEHVHLNLQLTEGGETGPEWIIQHVVDPKPYIDFNVVVDDRYYIPDYFFPDSGDYGRPFMFKNSWGEGDERIQVQRDGGLSLVVKNQNYEQRRHVQPILGRPEIVPGLILEVDTSRNAEEYYTTTGLWLPERMRVGDVFQRVQRVRVFRKRDCILVADYVSSDIMRLTAHYDTMTIGNGTLSDVLRFEWFINNRVDETYWYARGLSLVRWLKYTGQEAWFHEWAGGGNNERMVIPCL